MTDIAESASPVSSPSTWILQARPDRYDLSKIRVGETEDWELNQHVDEVASGDRVYLWQSGEEAAIHGVGQVMAVESGEREGRTLRSKKRTGDGEPYVVVRYIEKLDVPLPRDVIRTTAGLEKLSILRQAQGTVFAVTVDQAANLAELIRIWRGTGNREPEPGSAAEPTGAGKSSLSDKVVAEPIAQAGPNGPAVSSGATSKPFSGPSAVNAPGPATHPPGDPVPHTMGEVFDLPIIPSVHAALMSVAQIAPDEWYQSRRGPVAVSVELVLTVIANMGTHGPRPTWGPSFLLNALTEPKAASPDDFQRIVAGIAMRGGWRRSEKRMREDEARGVPVSSETWRLFQVALEHASETEPDRRIHFRHLVSALILTADSPAGPLAGVFREFGTDPNRLRPRFWHWVRGWGDDDEAWREILIGNVPLSYAYSGFDSDAVIGRDLLDIESDVRAFATLIAARTTKPPLSIGLFGDWGSGKSFFMRKLRQRVAELSKTSRDSGDMQCRQPFFKKVVQIEFNAWHYVEGNLWASLVEHIFDNLRLPLDERTGVVREMQEFWINKLEVKKAEREAANVKVTEAANELTHAEGILENVRREHEKKAADLARLNAANLTRAFQLSGARIAIDQALDQLGLSAASDSAFELLAELGKARSLVEQGGRTFAPLMVAKDRSARWGWLLLILFLGPFVAVWSFLICRWLGKEWLSQIAAAASGAATILTGLTEWLRRQTSWASTALKKIEDAQKVYDAELAAKQAETAKRITELENEISILRQRYQAAERQAESARHAQEEAAAELKQMTAVRLLGQFVQDRAESADYRKHLGLLALVREDFERLSGLIEEENWRLAPLDAGEDVAKHPNPKYATLEEESAGEDQKDRINRIVLYIDDLDRCPPAKVVDVLQAVHLLLAFPLFVVVVGVDARWIARSLQTRYRELLHVEEKDGGNGDLSGVATPEDYLEKIFQIPFWLSPMTKGSTRKMLRSLVPTDGASAATDGAQPGRPRNVPENQPGTDTIHEPLADSGRSDQTETLTPAGSPDTAPSGGSRERVRTKVDSVDAGGALGAGGEAGGASRREPSIPASGSAMADPKANDERREVAPSTEDAVRTLSFQSFERDYMERLVPLLGRSPRALKRFVNSYRLVKAKLSGPDLDAFLAVEPTQSLAGFQAACILLAVDAGLPDLAPILYEHLERVSPDASLDLAAKNLVNALDDDPRTRGMRDWTRLKEWLGVALKGDEHGTVTDALAQMAMIVSRFSFRTRGVERTKVLEPRPPARKKTRQSA